MKRSKSQDWPQAVLRSVQKAIQALPSEQDIKQSTEAIDSLITFLQSLKESLRQQPPQQVRQDVLKAATILSNFMVSYQAKTLLAQKMTSTKSTMASEEDVAQLFKELDALSLPEIQSRLLDKTRYSVKDLKALAKFLGIGIDRNFNREDAADTIFKRGFANPRGYDAIGGAPSQKLRDNLVPESKENKGPQADENK